MLLPMNYPILFFDLDGTLTDSEPGIINGVRQALREFDLEPDPAVLRSFIGPSLYSSFRNTLGFSEEDARRAVAIYRAYYTERGLFENAVYEGILPLLDDLVTAGYRLFIATAKPEPFAVRIADHFALSPRFEGLYGAELEQGRTEKDAVIRYALDQEELDPARVLMIGDRKHDMHGAKANGLASLGVLYGYGDRSELLDAGAQHLVETVADLRRFLLA